jgi:hypothetical protein
MACTLRQERVRTCIVNGPISPSEHDRFIPGIYNYCDGWCSACALAARCRVKAEMDAEDPPKTPEAFAAQIQTWFRRALDLVEDRSRELEVDPNAFAAGGAERRPKPIVTIDHARLVSRGKAYCEAVFGWQKQRPADPERRIALDPTFPQDVIDHFAIVLASKIQRAVLGLASDQEPSSRHHDWPKDADGSAKVAILAAERSRTAWSDLRDSGLASSETISAFEYGLTWLIQELDRLFPTARKFVRPGFDDR